MKPLIVANWKCNPTILDEAREILNGVQEGIRDIEKVEVIICPPFLYLPYWVEFFTKKEQKIKLGAQNCFWAKNGAFTGEISPKQLLNFGCEYVIIGHSERRKYLGETDEMINKKIKSALKVKLKPILCIGETEDEKKQGKTFKILKNQIQKALINLSTYQIANLILAYEPLWAIGTGKPCQSSEAKNTLLFLRKFLKKNQILYGGSVNSKNAVNYLNEAGFDGLLVGGASLNPKEFVKIVKNVNRS